MSKPVHLHINRLNRNLNIYLLLIPPIVYVLVLFLFLFGVSKNSQNIQIAIDSLESTVLGEEVELDKEVNTFSK